VNRPTLAFVAIVFTSCSALTGCSNSLLGVWQSDTKVCGKPATFEVVETQPRSGEGEAPANCSNNCSFNFEVVDDGGDVYTLQLEFDDCALQPSAKAKLDMSCAQVASDELDCQGLPGYTNWVLQD
jgi:hypothetical protein